MVANLGVCAAVLRRLHEPKILLGDTNRDNFLVSADGGRAVICDFASSESNADDRRSNERKMDSAQVWKAISSTRRTTCGTYMDRFTEVSGSEYGI